MYYILIFAILLLSTNNAFSETSAPDDVVSKHDIKNCVKHLKKTEKFLYPDSLKVESAIYRIENSKIILTLTLSQKNEYGGYAGTDKKNCIIEK